MRVLIPYILLVCLSITRGQAQKIAGIGIDGWAAYSIGGRGGQIIRVSNLNADGPGSLSEAIYATGPRIVVFEVGGVIDLQGKSLAISNPFITISGQTAPSPGITLINGPLYIRSHDVILQHIRVRPGASTHEVGWEPDAVSTTSAWNVIIDHCSVSWAVDENCSASGPRFEGSTPDDWRINTSHTLTMSNNIIAEGLSNSTHIKGEHSKGTLIHDNATEIAVLNNLFASNMDRNPLFKGGARGVVANNYIHNPGRAAIKFGLVDSEWLGYAHETGQMSVVGNVLQYGPNTGDIALCYVTNGPCEVYLGDNIAKNISGNDVTQYKGDIAKKVDTKPVWNDNINLIPARDVQENIIRNAGSRPWDRDSIDTRLINEMLSGSGSIIDHESEVGGFPVQNQTNSTFKAEEWNLDYMLKISPDITISTPVGADQFIIDSIITVISETGTNNENINYLELMVNGRSEGKIYQAPYVWEISFDSAGNYELLVMVERDSLMSMGTKTTRIGVIDPSATFLEELKPNTGSVSTKLFPNPFGGSVTLSYYLPEAVFVTLQIYNNMGQLVETLVSGLQSRGQQDIVWTPLKIPTGIYFYRLIAGDQIISKKMIYEKCFIR